MKKIKVLEKGNYRLEHFKYVDWMGFLRDSFDFFDCQNRIHYPFLPPIKVHNYDENSNIMDTTNNYTEKEYREMFLEQKNRLKLR